MSFDINKVIKVAETQVGYCEKRTNSQLDSKTANAGYNNYTKYARDFDTKYPNFYNGKKNGYDWCDIFVDWCFVEAYGEANALKLLGQPKKSCGAGCPWSANYFKQIGRFYTTPKVGDQIFFRNGNSTGHTGLVYKVDNIYVYTIEGNTSSASGVVANGGCVAKKKYTRMSSYIYGYGRPNYGVQKETKPTSKKKTTASKKTSKEFKSFTGYVIATELNVRQGAGTNYEIVGTLKKNKSVNVVGEKGGWYKIKYNNATAYVSKKYISKTKPKSIPKKDTTSFKPYKVKVTAKSGLNIRKNASTLSRKVGALTYGTVVTISKVSGKWGYVSNKAGWISLSYTSKV
jgi:SH3-like domain-containing protein